MEKTNKEMELCLCPACASAFYDIPSYRIIRKDPYQVEKETCTYCGSRQGYDFLISKRSNVQKSVRRRIRTLESEAENETLG